MTGQLCKLFLLLSVRDVLCLFLPPFFNMTTDEFVIGFVSQMVPLRCTLVVADDEHQEDRGRLFRQRHALFSPTVHVRMLPPTVVQEEEGEVDPNATEPIKPIWPKSLSATSFPAACNVFSVTFRRDNFEPLMEYLSSKIALRPGNDFYFIWLQNASDVEQELITSTYGRILKFKVAVVPTTNNAECIHDECELEIWSVCFYCATGEPELRSLGIHKYPPGQLDSVFLDTSGNMHGKFLRGIFLKPFSPKEIAEKRKRPDRAVMPSEVLTTILGDALNFEWIVEAMAVGDAGAVETQLDDGTWLGMVGEVLYGRADFCAGTPLSERALTVIDYPVPYFFDHVGFLTANPKLIFSWKVMVQPYTFDVWIGVLLATFLCTGAFHALLELQLRAGGPAFEPVRQSAVTYPSYSFLFLSTSLIGQSVEQLPSRIPLRLFMVFWWIFATVINCGYTSKLISFMTMPEKEILPTDLESLVHMKYVWGSPYKHGVFYHMLVENVDVETYHVIEEGLGSVDTVDDCLEEALTRRYACLSLRTYLSLGSLRYLDSHGEEILRLAPEAALAIHAGFMLPKHHVSRDAFSMVTRRTMEAGLLEPKTTRDIFQATRLQGLKLPPKSQGVLDDGPIPLTWKHVQGPFFCHAFGLGLSLLAFLVERAPQRKCARKTSKVSTKDKNKEKRKGKAHFTKSLHQVKGSRSLIKTLV